MLLKFFSAIILLLSAVDAYFYVPKLLTNLPFKGGMATASRNNNSLIMFGGENITTSYTNDFYQLTQVSDTYNWQIIPQTNPPPGNLYGQAVVTNDNNNMFLLGGVTNTTNNQLIPLQVYQYSFQSQTWTPSANNNAAVGNTTALPYNRKLFSATYDNQNKVYIYGGALNNSASFIFSDFYSMDLTTQQYTKLPGPPQPIARYGHTASLLSNGLLVFIGGVTPVSDTQFQLFPMNVIYVFDTKSNTWSMQKTSDTVLPSVRTSHTAVTTSDDRIIIFGGDNGADQRNRMYLNSIAILDTKTWQWSTPPTTGIPPSRRSYASGGLLNGNQLTVAFGAASNTFYNDLNVLNIETNQWLQSFKPVTTPSSGISAGIIAGVTIACIALVVIILFLLWKFQGYIRWFFKRLHRDIWKPRTGEPVWAETTRIVFQIFLLFIFAVFLTFVIRQAIKSPNITQTIEEAAATVDVPDVRFCFDGWPQYDLPDPRALGVSCQTDTGYSCSQFIKPLDMSVFKPTYADYLGPVFCYMFRAPLDFALTATSGANNGSRLLFTLWGDQSIGYGRVHTSVYPKRMNPNVGIYNISDGIPSLMPQNAIENWLINERNDIQATNVFDIQPFTYSALAYKLIDHQYLQNVGWNYVGFLPISNSTPEVDTTFRQEAQNPYYASGHQDLGLVSIFPLAYTTTIQREVKMYTLVNALGFVGGIFGLLVAIQAWLFGYRPRSPWGVVHRWSIGDMKRSLLRGLQSKFKITESGVPLVHPVHHRFSVTDFNNLDYDEPETQRINRVEERMQMLEMLFKAYYVDDEVFRSLDDANKAKELSRMVDNQPLRRPGDFNNDSGRFPTQSYNNTAPRNEKIIDDNTFATQKPAAGEYLPFSRQDTDQSSASNIPLTQRQHAPPYQPATKVQMHDL